ncbi:MAG: ribonuclease PH [Planctomycetaceae bacterium]|jgi:ribonuclease PH|nr:ribonuclease PH [Planctomycetaceae bacterium]
MAKRPDHRGIIDLRPIRMERSFPTAAPGSVLLSAGGTVVLCTASITESLPPWMKAATKEQDTVSGWLTAEYRMHPASTSPRSERRDRPDGRATEIQRLIGRSLRAVVDLELLGPRTVAIDCDVLKADGGTRTLSITGAFIALVEAVVSWNENSPYEIPLPFLKDSVAAVSVGILAGEPRIDLCYLEDVDAEVDMNVVMTGTGRFVEIQGTGEEATFSESELHEMLRLAKLGISRLTQLQKETLGTLWRFG